ncbi:MAG: DUF1624 domain-containing protein [Chitinophagaceae bacterium]|nr:DUF1624 domain-containing protein [Chitinophagaceae bacterium]
MQPSLTANQKRIESIDILRGIVMVIMALDHVRDFFHVTANTDDPLNLATTTPILFFTRWVTNFCAPVFVFLSGTSIYLQSLRKTKKELSSFLIKRGLWLIFAEWIIIAMAWTFNPAYPLIPFGVIWAIGICMLILGVATWLPFKALLTIGILIVSCHNLLDIPEAAPNFKAGFWWDLLHHGFFVTYEFAPHHFALLVYPFLPWLGLMLLGYCSGVFFTPIFSPAQRQKILARIGVGLIFLFVIVRLVNVYGDPVAWSSQGNGLLTFLSFMKVHKYPPSLMYICITMGPALLLLSLLEHFKNRFTDSMVVFGRTAFFYYILHLYLIHLLAVIFFFARGHIMQQALDAEKTVPFRFVLPGEGFGLAWVYVVWAALIMALYPLCKWYDRYKTNHKEKWWLSYL